MGFRDALNRHPVLLGGILYGLALVAFETVRDVLKGREVTAGDLAVSLFIAVVFGCGMVWMIRR